MGAFSNFKRKGGLEQHKRTKVSQYQFTNVLKMGTGDTISNETWIQNYIGEWNVGAL